MALLLLLCTLCLGAHAAHTIVESDLKGEGYGMDTKDDHDDIFKLYDFTFFPDETDLHYQNKRYSSVFAPTLCFMTFNIENYSAGKDKRGRNGPIARVSDSTTDSCCAGSTQSVSSIPCWTLL